MTEQEKLKVAREALERVAREPGCGCDFPCRCNGEEWERINTEGLRGIAETALAAINAPSTEQPAAASVDGPELPLPSRVGTGITGEVYTVEQLIAWGAQQREAGKFQEMKTWMDVVQSYCARAEAAEKERDALRAKLADANARLAAQAEGIQRMSKAWYASAQLARPVDLAGLTRYSVGGAGDLEPMEFGDALLFDDVQALLAGKVAPVAVQEPVAEAKHPMQPVVIDSVGTLRFKENAIVRFLAKERLNEIHSMDFSEADREQLVQLIGYSVSGTTNFEFLSDETFYAAQAAGEALLAQPAAKEDAPRLIDVGEGAIPDPTK